MKTTVSKFEAAHILQISHIHLSRFIDRGLLRPCGVDEFNDKVYDRAEVVALRNKLKGKEDDND